MKIAICIKQVPGTTAVEVDPVTGTLKRDGVESKLNPCDLYALETALRLKESCGAHLTAVTMGPPQARAVLRAALACGADDAYLVSSRAFGGADTLATSYTLASAVRTLSPDKMPDLVLFGKQAIDGDTAQVGPGVSEFLDVPLVTYVKELFVEAGNPSAYRAVTVMDDGEHVLEGTFPAVMTVLKGAAPPRYASLARALEAERAEIALLDEKALSADVSMIGLDGSPTKVVTIFPPPVKGGGVKIDAREDPAAGARAIIDFMTEKGWGA
jgi:electron transfer flavoprotein beta subunit